MNRRMILSGLAVALATPALATPALATPALAQQRERRGPNGGLLAGGESHEVALVANGTATRRTAHEPWTRAVGLTQRKDVAGDNDKRCTNGEACGAGAAAYEPT